MRIMTLVLSFGEEAYARQCDDIDIDITHIDMEHGFLVQWVYRECNLSRTLRPTPALRASLRTRIVTDAAGEIIVPTAIITVISPASLAI